MITINNLHVCINQSEILKGINLDIKAGEVHAIMGPNGSGKSTLSKVIAGHPAYSVTDGSIDYKFEGKNLDLCQLEPDERAKKGIFLSFQYPTEIAGITNFDFLKDSFNEICKAHGAAAMESDDFKKFLLPKLENLEMSPEFLKRSVNGGFSGGEKKKNEILQMSVLSPKLAILDETDSGLDIDALKIVAKGINDLKSQDNAILLITHYQRLLDHIVPDFVHVLHNGKIIKSGDKTLALELEKKGYDWLL